MANDEAERLLQLGQLLAEDRDYPLDGTLLYAEVGPNVVSAAVFKDRGDHILYRRDVRRFMYPLLDLWEESDLAKRWAEMEYVVRGGKFDATFTYPEEIDPEEDPFDRRDRIVQRHFGDKPIVYAPMPTDDDALFRL